MDKNINVKMQDETVWLTQQQLVELYQSSKCNVSEHIKHIFEEGELDEESVVWKFRTTASDGKNYNVIHYKLAKLGVECSDAEKLEKMFLDYPEDMLEDMGVAEIEAIIIDIIAFGSYNHEINKWETTNDRLFSFDVERFGGAMYGDPLECLNALSKGEFVISDVVEADWSVGEETGSLPIDFKVNGKEYHYDAKYNYDWFDTDIFKYIAEIIDKESTGSHLHMTPVGPQSALLFYETDEWVAEFEKLFWIL